jgi:xylulokinase
MSLLGLDIGTTGTKAVAFDERGCILASHYQDYPLYIPEPNQCELNPDEVWQAITGVLQATARDVRKKDPVRAIGISTLGDSVTPLDNAGHTLSPTVIGAADRRAMSQAAWIERQISREDIFMLTGAPLHAFSAIPKILWFRERRPDIFERVYKFTGWQEIVHLRLGLEPAMDFSLASRTMLADMATGSWAEGLMRMCGISSNLFFPLARADSTVGVLERHQARSLDLEPGVTVVTGGFDQCCCALGAGVIEAGKAANSVGTLESIVAVSDSRRLELPLLEGNYGCGFHVIEGAYYSLGYVTTSGAVLRWYRDELGSDEAIRARERGVDPYDLIINGTKEQPAPVYLLPYFAGTGTPWLDTKQKGTLFGLSLDTQRSDIVKAMLDGICYEVRVNLEAMSNAGIEIAALRSIGGGTRSGRWMQLKADITGIPIEVTEVTEAGCLGAAFLAGLGSGVYGSPADISTLITVRKTYEPQEKQRRAYDEHYGVYVELRERVRGLEL